MIMWGISGGSWKRDIIELRKREQGDSVMGVLKKLRRGGRGVGGGGRKY